VLGSHYIYLSVLEWSTIPDSGEDFLRLRAEPAIGAGEEGHADAPSPKDSRRPHDVSRAAFLYRQCSPWGVDPIVHASFRTASASIAKPCPAATSALTSRFEKTSKSRSSYEHQSHLLLKQPLIVQDGGEVCAQRLRQGLHGPGGAMHLPSRYRSPSPARQTQRSNADERMIGPPEFHEGQKGWSASPDRAKPTHHANMPMQAGSAANLAS